MSESEDQVKNPIDGGVPLIRYIFVLPIIASFVASLVLLMMGFVETFRVIAEAAVSSHGHAMEILRLQFIEVLDVFLLATVLFVIANGFYQLFLGRHPKLPEWMRVDSVHDLEVMLLGVIVTVLGVSGLAAVMSWNGQTNLLPLGATVALLIAAIAYFLGRTSH